MPLRSAALGEWEIADGARRRRHASADDRARQPQMSRPRLACAHWSAFGGRSLAAATRSASAPTFWTVSTQTDFLKGDVENISIDSDGRVLLGPATTQVAETSAPFLWTLVAAGPTARSGPAAATKARSSASTASGRTTTVLRRAGDRSARACAGARWRALRGERLPTARSTGSMPAGTSKTFFDPDDKYIWALAVDREGAVFVRLARRAIIYRIAPDGKGTPFYETDTAHVVTLALDRPVGLVAGTESPGRVLRIDRDGKAFVLLDSPFQEIRALRFAPDGALYAVAFSGPPGGPATAPPIEPSEPPARTRRCRRYRARSRRSRSSSRDRRSTSPPPRGPTPGGRRAGRSIAFFRRPVGHLLGVGRRRAV